MLRLLPLLLLLPLLACSEEESPEPVDVVIDLPIPDATIPDADPGFPPIPWEGEALEELSESPDPRDYFPAIEGAEWRYRPRSEEWMEPLPPEQGAWVRLSVGEGEGEWIREVLTTFESKRGDEPRLLHQRIEEIWVITPNGGQQGPSLAFKSFDLEELDLLTREFVRSESRLYEPPYPVIFDGYHPEWDPQQQGTSTMTQITRRNAEEEPREMEAEMPTLVKIEERARAIPMEGIYREPTHKMEISDEPGSRVGRTYWFQAGIGIIQQSYGPDQENATFTLMESNLPEPLSSN